MIERISPIEFKRNHEAGMIELLFSAPAVIAWIICFYIALAVVHAILFFDDAE